MDRFSKVFIAILAGILGLIVLLFILDIGRSRIYASPEEVFNASKAALAKKDFRAFAECMTDESRDLQTVELVMEAYALSRQPELDQGGDKRRAKALEQVLDRHGLSLALLSKSEDMMGNFDKMRPEQRLKVADLLLEPVRDRNGLFEDLSKTLLQNPAEIWKDATLSEVKTQGNRAIGLVTLTVGDKEKAMPLPFKKVNEGWRIEMLPIDEPQQLPPGHRGM